MLPLGFIGFLVCVIVGRIVVERALRHLTSDDKVRLLDSFSAIRMFRLVPLVILFAAYIGLVRYTTLPPRGLLAGFIALLLVHMAVFQAITLRKFKQLELSGRYVRQFLIGNAVSFGGFAFLVAFLF